MALRGTRWNVDDKVDRLRRPYLQRIGWRGYIRWCSTCADTDHDRGDGGTVVGRNGEVQRVARRAGIGDVERQLDGATRRTRAGRAWVNCCGQRRIAERDADAGSGRQGLRARCEGGGNCVVDFIARDAHGHGVRVSDQRRCGCRCNRDWQRDFARQIYQRVGQFADGDRAGSSDVLQGHCVDERVTRFSSPL